MFFSKYPKKIMIALENLYCNWLAEQAVSTISARKQFSVEILM